MWHHFLNLFVVSFIFLSTKSLAHKNCTYDYHPNQPEVYYINLKRSIDRDKSMQQLLSSMKLRHFRVEAVSSSSLYVPSDLIPQQSGSSFPNVYKYKSIETIETSSKVMGDTNKHHLIHGLCTRGILWTELYCSMSHLLAIYRAVHSPTATSEYALIMEDDIHIPISTDYNELAASAPSDFGILQLLTVNARKVIDLWGLYDKQHTLWSKRNNNLYWSTGIYLINREKLRPIIDSIIHIDPIYPTIIQYTLIASKPRRRKDIPYECTSYFKTTMMLACVRVGNLAADRYIYAMSTTYMFRLPIAYVQSGFKTTV